MLSLRGFSLFVELIRIKSYRKISYLLLTLLIFGIVVIMAYGSVNYVLMPINKIQIIAPVRYVTEEEVKNMLMQNGIDRMGFFYINMQRIKSALQQNPWVSNVSISRIWPDTIRITYREAKPLAYWNDTGIMTSSSCKIIPFTENVKAELKSEITELQAVELPLLVGDEKNSQKLCDTLEKLQKSIKTIDMGIKKLTVNRRGSWYLELTNGVLVLLGNKDVLNRADKFIGFYSKVKKITMSGGLNTNTNVISDVNEFNNKLLRKDAMSGITYIDMRYNNGFAVGSDTREKLTEKMESS